MLLNSVHKPVLFPVRLRTLLVMVCAIAIRTMTTSSPTTTPEPTPICPLLAILSIAAYPLIVSRNPIKSNKLFVFSTYNYLGLGFRLDSRSFRFAFVKRSNYLALLQNQFVELGKKLLFCALSFFPQEDSVNHCSNPKNRANKIKNCCNPCNEFKQGWHAKPFSLLQSFSVT